MLYMFVIFFLMFLILGLFSFTGKLNSLLSNGKVDAEGDPIYDEKAISKFLGTITLLLSLSAFLGILGFTIKGAAFLVVCAPVLFVGVMVFALLYSGCDQRFRMKKRRRRYRR